MANYNKSFNFKNGVQVDVDKFIVRGSLVGIGTSIPGETFDVLGNVRVAGLVTTTNLNVTGIATFNQVRVGSIQLSASAGVVTATAFYGNGATLSNLPTSQWVDVDVGLGFTSIYAAGNVGVSTVDPRFSLQIGANPLDNLPGVGINSNGNIITTGIISATSFIGAGFGITSINASNITGGSLPSTVIPQSLFIGVVTATTFFGTLVGIASTALSLSGSPNIAVSNITSSNISNSGIVSSYSVVSGVSSIGISTVSTRLYAESIGVGTNSPLSDIHIRRTSTSELQVTSDSADAIVAFGRSTTLTGNNGVLRFGNTSGLYPYSTPSSVDIINYAVGNINSYLHLGASGLGTGAFNWLYGQNLTNLMSLTYDGKLGIGITTPITTLHVVGTSTVTGNAYVGSNLFVNSNLNVNGSLTVNGNTLGGGVPFNSNIYATSGISTVVNLHVYNPIGVSSVGLGTDKPEVGLDARNDIAYFTSLGLSTTTLFNGYTTLAVKGFSQLEGVGIGTTVLYDPQADATGYSYGQLQIHTSEDFDASLALFGSRITLDQFSSVGFNTYNARSIFDFGRVGTAVTLGYIIPPTLTTAQRISIASTVAGGMIYNSTAGVHQFYNGSTWRNISDLYAANAGFSTVAGVSTSVIGGIGSITSLSVSGITTTARLNVGTGGTVITTTAVGLVGIGTTSPVDGYNLTVGSNGIHIKPGGTLNIGSPGYFTLSEPTAGSGRISASPNLNLRCGFSGSILFDNPTYNMAEFVYGGQVDLYFAGSKKFQTSSSGVTVTGTTQTDNLNVGTGITMNSGNTGIITATGGFASGVNNRATQIWVSGNRLIFNVVGIGSTSFALA
jgi:hypothetical protein